MMGLGFLRLVAANLLAKFLALFFRQYGQALLDLLGL